MHVISYMEMGLKIVAEVVTDIVFLRIHMYRD